MGPQQMAFRIAHDDDTAGLSKRFRDRGLKPEEMRASAYLAEPMPLTMSKPPLLFLPHRIPYPPNKGDKLRSFHMLSYLARHYSVHVGTFIDYPEDWQHVGVLEGICASVYAEGIRPLSRKAFALRGLLTGESLTLPYYRSSTMRAWVNQTLQSNSIERAVIFSSSMAQYIEQKPSVRAVVDFCDVDSAKWAHYAQQAGFPKRWLYGREARCLLSYECSVAAWARASVFVSDTEAELFKSVAPGCDRVHTMSNGVDADYYSPAWQLTSPYASAAPTIVFTGAMDYLPNIDAVSWFVKEVWPRIRQRFGDIRFYIVGMKPTAEVLALASDNSVVVTGAVADVRPYLMHAQVAVAPLRIARGIQNKVLEAMSMAKPVVVSRTCAQGLSAAQGVEYLAAESPDDYLLAIESLLEPQAAHTMGCRARARVVRDYSWTAHLTKLSGWLESRD